MTPVFNRAERATLTTWELKTLIPILVLILVAAVVAKIITGLIAEILVWIVSWRDRVIVLRLLLTVLFVSASLPIPFPIKISISSISVMIMANAVTEVELAFTRSTIPVSILAKAIAFSTARSLFPLPRGRRGPTVLVITAMSMSIALPFSRRWRSSSLSSCRRR